MNDILQFIAVCGKGAYSIEQYACTNIPKKRKSQLVELIAKEEDCYKERESDTCDDGSGHDIYIILMILNDEVIGYLAYSMYEMNGHKVQYIMYSCNASSERGKKISVILRAISMVRALEQKCTLVVSQTNAVSGGILEKYFNFTLIPDLYANQKYSTLSGQIQKEFNAIYTMDSPESLQKVQSNVVNAIKECKLASKPTGGSRRRRKGRRARSRRVRSSS